MESPEAKPSPCELIPKEAYLYFPQSEGEPSLTVEDIYFISGDAKIRRLFSGHLKLTKEEDAKVQELIDFAKSSRNITFQSAT